MTKLEPVEVKEVEEVKPKAVRKGKFAKGSQEAKDFMKALRDKRKPIKKE